MPSRAPRLARRLADGHATACLGEHLAEDADDLVHLGLTRDERWRELDDRVAAIVGATDEPGLEHGG